jgi:hypothetical protein
VAARLTGYLSFASMRKGSLSEKWPYQEVLEIGADFRLGEYSEKYLLTLSSSLRDPLQTFVGVF